MKRSVVVALGTLLACSGVARADTVRLSLKEAESRAVQGHPLVRAGEYNALAAGEAVRQARSAYFPTVFGSLTGAQAGEGTRIAAGGLNNPTILDRFAYGFSISQLLTDFGRTSSLVASASLLEDAQQRDVAYRRGQVLLNVDRAYFDVLRAQAILRVADQTVHARQLVVDQVAALASTGLKSSLDLSFAKVNLSEAQLTFAQAGNDLDAAYARLSAALGTPDTVAYDLVDEPMPEAPADDSAALVASALRERSDLGSERLAAESAQDFAAAERALWFPSVALVGAAGATPYHNAGLNDRYGALGVNITVPLTNGSMYQARRAQANFRASAEEQRVKDAENRVARDVQIAWLNARTAYQRVGLTEQLLSQASDALDLATQRYTLGLSSIIELTQAQLNKTEAEIQQATARYEYQSRTAALRFELGQLK